MLGWGKNNGELSIADAFPDMLMIGWIRGSARVC